MNKGIYERNMEALERKYPVWAQILRENKRKKQNFDVIVEQSYTDEPIMKVEDCGKVYYLNGKYAPSRVVENWLERQGTIDKFATIIIIGISNGMHIRKIMQSVAGTVNIMIYEPSYEIFRRAMEEVDLSFIFELNIPVGIVVEKINGFEIGNYFQKLITYDNMISLKIYMSGNYKVLFPNEVGDFVSNLQRYMQHIEVNWNTVIRYTDINARNVFHNLKYLYDGYSVEDLKGILPEDVPVIVVSAGPSLKKNIMDLKKAVGKACIIATDTAMKPLLNAGIMPDLFVIVDGLKPAELFKHKDISKVGMVTMTAVSPEPMDLHKGKKYFYNSESPFETEMLKMIDRMDERKIILTNIPTGGSVATTAYSLGIQMGAKTIILVGQDLALTGNKEHVDGAFKDEKLDINMESGEYLEVESVDGGKVVTRVDFKWYLDWFENMIKVWSHIKVVDATEGGALIHGAKTMSLKKAISKYCINDYNVRWHIARIPKLLSKKEEQEYILKRFEDSVKDLNRVKQKAEEGIACYEKIRKSGQKGLENRKKLSGIYKKIKKINNFMEHDAMAETVIDSLKGIEYTLRPTIYHTKDDENEEILEVAEQGILMLTAITYGADEIAELAEKTIIPFALNKRLEL